MDPTIVLGHERENDMKQARPNEVEAFREKIASALPQTGATDIRVDDDGDFVFRHGDLHLLIVLDERDPGYLRVVLPRFAEADTPERHALLLAACAETCGIVKLAKLFFIGRDLCSTVEAYVPRAESIDSPFLERLVTSTIAAAACVLRGAQFGDPAAPASMTQPMVH